jgi:hypothetical protein
MSDPPLITLNCRHYACESELTQVRVSAAGLDDFDTFKRVSLIGVRDHRLVGAIIS